MTLDRAVMAFAGFIVLVSLALAYLFNPYWLLLTTVAGVNLIVQPSFTGFCPARDRVQATRGSDRVRLSNRERAQATP